VSSDSFCFILFFVMYKSELILIYTSIYTGFNMFTFFNIASKPVYLMNAGFAEKEKKRFFNTAIAKNACSTRRSLSAQRTCRAAQFLSQNTAWGGRASIQMLIYLVWREPIVLG
jgi:hypothetical protein